MLQSVKLNYSEKIVKMGILPVLVPVLQKREEEGVVTRNNLCVFRMWGCEGFTQPQFPQVCRLIRNTVTGA